jgi:hypothetical protein
MSALSRFIVVDDQKIPRSLRSEGLPEYVQQTSDRNLVKIWSVNIMMLKEHKRNWGNEGKFEFSRPNVIWGGGAGATRSTPPRSDYDEIEAETRV